MSNLDALTFPPDIKPARTPVPSLPGFERAPDGKPLIGLDAEDLYAFGHLIRLTEQLILDQFSRGLVSGTTHTCLGQELAAMAVVRALDHPEDAVLSNHRNHGHFLTYSGDFLGLVAEIMGREAGVCGGRGAPGQGEEQWRRLEVQGFSEGHRQQSQAEHIRLQELRQQLHHQPPGYPG